MTDGDLDREAADWLLLHELGDMTNVKREAFADWLARPEAGAAYRHAERAWRVVGELGVEKELASSLPAPDDHEVRRSTRHWAISGLCACAALMIAAFPSQLMTFIDVQLAPVRGGGQAFSTSPDHRTSATLADGTFVTLDVGTRMRVLEMGAQRRVELLAGHAFFKVAHDPAHPFLVTAMNKTVHAIGTAFDVRVQPDAVSVILVEGKVRVDQSRGLLHDSIATDMTPGKQLIASNDHVWLMTPVDTSRATAWLKEQLFYTKDTVGRIVADMNAGSRRKIVFQGSVDGEQPLFGVFERGDVDSLATVLEVKGIAHVVSRNEHEIVMAPAGH